MFSFFKKKSSFFTAVQRQQIVDAIRSNERRTSGEIRVFVESRCSWVNPVDRAMEIFYGLKMEKTEQRNAVLIYVAIKHRQVAVVGDEGIHNKVGTAYWQNEVAAMIKKINSDSVAEGIRQCVIDIGEALYRYFPYDNDTDKNELPDDIVFGK